MILLLVSRNFVTKDRIRDVIDDYRGGSDEAFEKMFERDKDELRSLGIPIEVGHLDAFFEDEVGYRIKRDAFELPQVELEPDEAAVVGLAARVWQHAGLADATSQALLKLKAAGPPGRPRGARRRAATRWWPTSRRSTPCGPATQSRTPVAFDYRRSGLGEPTRRHVQPWGVVTARGRWYVVGHDSDRGEPRLFRLSRIVGDVATDGRPGSFVVPEGTDVRALTRSLAPEQPVGRATVRVRKGAAQDLRRRAVSTADAGEGWDVLELEYADLDTAAGEVLAALDAVVAVEPPELRDLVVDRLSAVAREAPA